MTDIRTPQSNRLNPPKSGLDLIGMYLEVVRSRFRSDDRANGFPWYWSKDSGKASILVEAGGVDTTNLKDVRPAVFVDRSAIVIPKIVIGDKAGENLQTGKMGFYSIATTQMNINCIARRRGESAALGDILLSHILMSSDVFQRYFLLKDCTPVTLGPTQPWEKDSTLFVTQLTSEVSFDMKWYTSPIASKISALILSVTANTTAVWDPDRGLIASEDDPDVDLTEVLFTRIAMTSLNQ